jgi:hypothetical protein
VTDLVGVEHGSETKLSLDKKKIGILLLEGIHVSAVGAFRADGYTNITRHETSLPEEQLLEAVRGASIIGVRSATHLTRKVLELAQGAIAVGCFCIGTNQVDLGAAEEFGVPVFNAPFSNTRSVAELVLAEIVLLMRGVPFLNAATHRGEWVKTAVGSFEVRGKRLGIIGYGHIGTQVGLLAEAVGMQVVYHDIEAKLALGDRAHEARGETDQCVARDGGRSGSARGGAKVKTAFGGGPGCFPDRAEDRGGKIRFAGFGDGECSAHAPYSGKHGRGAEEYRDGGGGKADSVQQ